MMRVPEVEHAVQGGGAGAGRLVAEASEPPVDGHGESRTTRPADQQENGHGNECKRTPVRRSDERNDRRQPSGRGPGSRELGNKANPEWPLGHPRRRQILLVLCLSLLVVVIENTILNTALPTLARVLHAGTSSLQWITDAYTLCFAALLIPAGALGDRFGRRISLLGGLTVFALGSVAAALSTGTGTLIAARVVMGLGATFVMPATLSILNAVFPPKERPPKERPQEIAGWSAVAGVGIILGPTLGGCCSRTSGGAASS